MKTLLLVLLGVPLMAGVNELKFTIALGGGQSPATNGHVVELSPGGHATGYGLFGTENMPPQTFGTYPTVTPDLRQFCLLIDDTPALLVYVSRFQINFVVPPTLPVRESYSVRAAERCGTPSERVIGRAIVQPGQAASPEMLHRGPVALATANGAECGSAEKPAPRGGPVSFWMVGVAGERFVGADVTLVFTNVRTRRSTGIAAMSFEKRPDRFQIFTGLVPPTLDPGEYEVVSKVSFEGKTFDSPPARFYFQ
jgi:uncharacterized protein (TIGR03437 family)